MDLVESSPQIGCGKRLGEEETLILGHLGGARTSDVAGHEEDVCARSERADGSSYLETVNARHDDVGQQHVDRAGMTSGDLDRPLAARRLQHVVPRSLENRLEGRPDAPVVFDEEDRPCHVVIVDARREAGNPATRPRRATHPTPVKRDLRPLSAHACRLPTATFGGFAAVPRFGCLPEGNTCSTFEANRMSAETAPALFEASSTASALAPAKRSAPRSSTSATAASLYERYYDRVYGYCLYKLGNREEAEDATQTTFLLVIRGLERGVVPRMEANWLFTIAQNACRCRARTRGRGREREVLSDPHVLQEVAPGRNAAREELVGLEEALEDMPDLQRQAIILREWRGCSYREIAEQLGLTGAAVETLIFRARRSLAQRLEHQTVVTKRRAGAFAFDFASIASALKSALGIGSGVKAGITASTIAALAIGIGVPGDSPRAPAQPVTPNGSATPAEPRVDQLVVPGVQTEPAAKARPETATPPAVPGASRAAREKDTGNPGTTLEGTLGQVGSSLPTAGLVDTVEQQANEIVESVTAPVTDTLAPVAKVTVPPITLP